MLPSKVIDCRSDTVTKPNPAMMAAMVKAELGDDVYREDPTVLQLEKEVASMLAFEAGLFVPTGSMGNLISCLVHCWNRGGEIILGDKSHIHVYEQGSIAQFGGIHHRAIKNEKNGTFDVEQIYELYRSSAPMDPHSPITMLVCIENSHNKCGGRAVPMSWLQQVGKACKELKLPLHCDGARLFNTAAALKVPAKELVKDCASVSVCLSKGLGTPVGSVIVGSHDFIGKAIRVRKALGGGMRQVGVLAAAGLHAIRHNIDRLELDHLHAKQVAKVIADHGDGVADIDENAVDTNLVFVKLRPDVISTEDFIQRMEEVSSAEEDRVSVKLIAMGKDVVRISFHLNIGTEDVPKLCTKLKYVLAEIKNKK